MKYTKGNKPLGLEEKYKFGIEIEVNNVNTYKNTINKIKNIMENFKGKFTDNTRIHTSLYHSKESNEFFKTTLSSKGKPFKRANRFEEGLVSHGGAEIVSPILYDTEQDWDAINKVCKHLKKYPGKRGKDVAADQKCGFHVHFDAGLLIDNKKQMETFMKLWPQMEELVYKICNEENDPIRKSAITPSKKPLSLGRKIAKPTGKKIQKQIEEGRLKLPYKKSGFVRSYIITPLKVDNRRYNGLNLSNIGNPKKNTIEFRMSNGTINSEVIKQNIYLYASIINTARNIAVNKEYKKEELLEFLKTNISEEEKMNNFNNLVFANQEDKDIYKKRWESNSKADIFTEKSSKVFAKTFNRDDIKEIAKTQNIKNIVKFIQNIKTMLNNKNKNKDKER